MQTLDLYQIGKLAQQKKQLCLSCNFHKPKDKIIGGYCAECYNKRFGNFPL